MIIITQNHEKAPIFFQGIFESSFDNVVNDHDIEIMIYEHNFGHKCKELEQKYQAYRKATRAAQYKEKKYQNPAKVRYDNSNLY